MTAPRPKSAAALADEADQIAEIRKATAFSASIRYGPHDKRTADCANYFEAVEAKRLFEAESKFGRRAIIYAINPLGSFPVTPELAEAAGLVGNPDRLWFIGHKTKPLGYSATGARRWVCPSNDIVDLFTDLERLAYRRPLPADGEWVEFES